MAKFEIGDRVKMHFVPLRVKMHFVPLVVEVLEIGTCEDGDGCESGPETFRFKDPETGDDDWAHTSEFEVVR